MGITDELKGFGKLLAQSVKAWLCTISYGFADRVKQSKKYFLPAVVKAGENWNIFLGMSFVSKVIRPEGLHGQTKSVPVY